MALSKNQMQLLENNLLKRVKENSDDICVLKNQVKAMLNLARELNIKLAKFKVYEKQVKL